jgi:membrane protease YdiL (CAAX protease family)
MRPDDQTKAAATFSPARGTWNPGTQLDTSSRRRIGFEIALVLGLSLGASAIYSIVSIIDLATRAAPLSSNTAKLNVPLNSREVFDFIYQVLGIVFDMVPVALVAFLLWNVAKPHLARLGFDFQRPWRDALSGLGLAAIIGVPGIALYLGGKALGLTVTVDANSLGGYWWTIPVLLLSALRAGLQEEVIVIGYLFARLRDLGWGKWQIILTAAVLRGSYHLYQGYGSFIGNLAMGVLFGWLYTRYKRVLPLVMAHFIIDAAVFVGYPWAASAFPVLFG